MKKLVSTIVSLVSVLCMALPAHAAATAQQITINGKTAAIPANMGEIMEKDDRTFVPLRFVAQNMKCGVSFDDGTQFALVVDSGSTFMIKNGDSRIYRIPDGASKANIIQMDTTTFIVEYEEGGRMYVPVRFLAEAMGYIVGWDEATGTVSLTTAPPEPPAETPAPSEAPDPADTPAE